MKFKVFPQENRMLEEERQAGQTAPQGKLFKNLKWRDTLSWPREAQLQTLISRPQLCSKNSN